MAKRMPINLQLRQIRTELVDAGYEPELSDIRAHMDSTLTFPENRILIGNVFGYRAGRVRPSTSRLDDLYAQSSDYYAAERRRQAAAKRRAAPKKKSTQPPKCGPKGKKRWQSDRWLVDLYPEKIERDRRRKAAALPPGCRISKSGNRYYERRTNRSDMPGRKV